LPPGAIWINTQRDALILQDSTCRPLNIDLSGHEYLLARQAEHFMIRPLATAEIGSATN